MGIRVRIPPHGRNPENKINVLINLSRFKKEKKLSEKGFTLLELLIAATIFAFTITALLQMFICCTFLDQVNRNNNIARSHAEAVMERIMAYMKSGDVDPLKAEIDAGNLSWNYSTIGNNLGCPSPYAYPCVLNNESIATFYNNTTSDPLGIAVTVNWKNRAQTNASSLCLETLISKRE